MTDIYILIFISIIIMILVKKELFSNLSSNPVRFNDKINCDTNLTSNEILNWKNNCNLIDGIVTQKMCKENNKSEYYCRRDPTKP
jgi:hypothetical protein